MKTLGRHVLTDEMKRGQMDLLGKEITYKVVTIGAVFAGVVLWN
ncbi:MAG: hypothetical protein NTU69_09720 [Proteobacteria bacterium]|nr:hypothetical protein [Pseudomonadota bacterium]